MLDERIRNIKIYQNNTAILNENEDKSKFLFLC
jgi:hypothetical protein